MICSSYRSRLIRRATTCTDFPWERGFWLYGLFLLEFRAAFGGAGTLLFSFSYLHPCFLFTFLLLIYHLSSLSVNAISQQSQGSAKRDTSKKEKGMSPSLMIYG